MEKKSSVGVKVLGWVIIVSNLYVLCFNWWFIERRLLTHIYWWVSPVAVRLEMLMFLFPANPATHDLGLLWAIVLISCGIGMLLGKKLARIVFISCCGINAVANLIYFLWLYLSALLRYISILGLWQGILRNGIGDIIFGIFPTVIAALYIVYLSRPKVKEQFK